MMTPSDEARLREGFDWADKHDPSGSSLAGFLALKLREAMGGPPPRRTRFKFQLILKHTGNRGGHGPWLIEDQAGVVIGTVDLVDLINSLFHRDR